VIHCRRCGVALVAKPDGKKGRPKEYCSDCEAARPRERHRKWRRKSLTRAEASILN
jgi:DNA-directed RNA polymerase subunit M/transcription elongation factor TFIIS